MHERKTSEPEHTTEESGVQLTDLDPLDHIPGRRALRIASILLGWQRSPQRQRGRQYWRRASTPANLLLLVVLFSLIHVPTSLLVNSLRAALFAPSPASSPVAPLPQQDGIACLVDAAWSPESTVIAVLGYSHTCSPADAAGLVNLYDAHSRRLLAQLHPASAIVSALKSSLPLVPRAPVTIDYVHLIWSPDGHRLACTFNMLSVQSPVNGVLLMDRDGGRTQVLLQPRSPTTPFYAEWDLLRSRSVPFTSPPTAFSLMPLPPALVYHWGANGALVPEELLTPTAVPAASPPGPIGNPDGDASFTLWQPGSVHVMTMADSSRLFSWSTVFAAWSLDGRYLIDGMILSGVLKPPGQPFPGSDALALARLNQAPLLPIPDAAFLKVLDTATICAWSPNGRLLVAYRAGKSVDLYDGATGHLLASFRLQRPSLASLVDAMVLRWSPDGSQVLFASMQWGLLTLWASHQPQGWAL